MSITQRISDYLRERRIRRLSRQAKAAYAAGDRQRTRELLALLAIEMMARSQEQAARLDRAHGLDRGK
ncbi:putative exported protein of unknown function [Pseudoxanthomonas suwonensis 11-1]|uniref:Uncharacterized protein n=1 Tax=Pseudoxanthomonas suwonensis (strain 11-1) TaxID=743721 RepID=E6WS49_PSEUU|nr:hypothetical protein [Pseudoxanthomonas suwonensis]ADV26998.1 putative exported protein of unknown function [Pseudoxanthomonas suwonensis 11-1]